MRDVVGDYLEPDAAIVPIGDHFTMGPRQAAIAVDWLDVDHAFPQHYDTFPPIEQDPRISSTTSTTPRSTSSRATSRSTSRKGSLHQGTPGLPPPAPTDSSQRTFSLDPRGTARSRRVVTYAVCL